MDHIGKILQRYPVLVELERLLPPGEGCHLVGGALRDALLDRPSGDFDFTTPDDPTPLAKTLARTLAGRWFPLDPARHQSRVLLTTAGQTLTCDFAPWRGPTLVDDLRLRDFTLNALAWPLGTGGTPARLIDPLHGARDLQRGLLRPCSEQAFHDDPLRILRGVRLAGRFGLTLEEGTLTLMQAARAELSRVADERILQELAGIFAAGRLPQSLDLLHRLGLAEELLGMGARMDRSALLDRLQCLDRLLPQLDRTFQPPVGLAAEQLTDGFTRWGFFRLATLLRTLQADGPLPPALCFRRLSCKGRRLLRDLLALPADPAGLVGSLPQSPRGQGLWVERLGAQPGEVLRFLAAGQELSKETLKALEQAFCTYRQLAVQGRVPDLISGDWVRANLGFPAGPHLGRALEQVRKAEREGRVNTLQDGENLLKSIGEKLVDRSLPGPYNRPHVERE